MLHLEKILPTPIHVGVFISMQYKTINEVVSAKQLLHRHAFLKFCIMWDQFLVKYMEHKAIHTVCETEIS